MKKMMLVTTLMLSSVGASALGAFGHRNDGGRDDSPARDGRDSRPGLNSSAGFLSESVEHALRRLVALDAPAELNNVVSVEAAYQSATQATVVLISTPTSEFKYSCSLFDDFSRGGTVVKKEVRCAPTR